MSDLEDRSGGMVGTWDWRSSWSRWWGGGGLRGDGVVGWWGSAVVGSTEMGVVRVAYVD